ncbi:putative Na+/H+ antiporter [Ruficoccus amylovorans]|uniref:Putative Na+/H+ antiporter n=1 Tax=Ruficoccus amylovorans TaxID=1804625 RepID=A0A842HC54_9BACT|nr:putative Na+/H+ antiporter [Ruficoccus amylovorans]MBC2594055.1 putative Na+/H+ antiporter [Ruficoccus amylovorans]
MPRFFPTILACLCLCLPFFAHAAGDSHADLPPFPLPLEDYRQAEEQKAAQEGVEELGLWETLVLRAEAEPINLVVTALFLGAIIHTFLAGKFMSIAHRLEEEHAAASDEDSEHYVDGKSSVSFKATVFHFLGEVEAIFGIWVLPLFAVISFWPGLGFPSAVRYIDSQDYTEPVFVVVIMAIASSRPILQLARDALSIVAGLGKRSPAAWWLSILTIAPVLGSFITEPAAMTIAALLLGQQFYKYKPAPLFAYATLGLLFVNVSVGGTLTHFAAPPVLMVATPWEWNLPHMLLTFGWRAVAGILISNTIYFLIFRKHFATLVSNASVPVPDAEAEPEEAPVPGWIVAVHVGFVAWTVMTLHHPPLFVGGFLVFIAFTVGTAHFQYQIKLRGPMLVGFFLAALKIHGGLQGWWISPVLGSLDQLPLFIGSTMLTAVNDNAAITYLASQVPVFDIHTATGAIKEGADFIRAEALQYAVVAGAVTGGGLTVIANAPNPAGQSILNKFFKDGISPLGLFLGALVPTIVMAICFMVFPHISLK